jgi:hypothetical protein
VNDTVEPYVRDGICMQDVGGSRSNTVWGVDWINLPKFRAQRLPVVDTVIIIWVPLKVAYFSRLFGDLASQVIHLYSYSNVA